MTMLATSQGKQPAVTSRSDPSFTRSAIFDVVEWLTSDECHNIADAGLIAGLGRRLRFMGLPIDRLALHLRTLHPEIIGRSVAWAPDEPVEIRDHMHGIEASPNFIGSPVRRVMETHECLTVRMDGPETTRWTNLDIYRGRELVELLILPLNNFDASASAAAFCTSRPGGFFAAERAALERIVPALRNLCELRILRKVELTLLDTYVGTATARRVLAGRIQRGQVESLEAALMLCDLRGFTELSNRLSPAHVLKTLDTYFDHVVPAITEAGGEIVKFMGDAVLAFFQCDDASIACKAALQAAFNSLENLDRLTEAGTPLHAGISLHYGEVSYGNIGSGGRLDFTVIGPDVNLISRIQGVCSASGRSLLTSERFAKLLDSSGMVSIGKFDLKGFSDSCELFNPIH